MTTTRFEVPAISCETCKTSLEGALGQVSGVHDVRVDIDSKSVTVSYEPPTVDTARLIEVIEKHGSTSGNSWR